jgi:hypothetical protein
MWITSEWSVIRDQSPRRTAVGKVTDFVRPEFLVLDAHKESFVLETILQIKESLW